MAAELPVPSSGGGSYVSETMYDKDAQLQDTRDETSIRSSDPKLKAWLTIQVAPPPHVTLS